LLLKEPVYMNMGEEGAGAVLYGIEEANMNGYLSGMPLQVMLTYTLHTAIHEPGVADKEENTVLEVVKMKGKDLVRLVTTTIDHQRRVKYFQYSNDDGKYIPVGGR
jgi:hypothetical protein